MPKSFRNFVNSVWKGMTSSKSLPSTSQQQEPPRQPSSPSSPRYDDAGDDDDNNNNNNNNVGGHNDVDDDDDDFFDEDDPLLWSNDLEKHSCGEFSHAMVQSNYEMRTYSQVEVGCNGMFVGTYDGHIGHHAAEYISRNLITNLISYITEDGSFSREALVNAILATEEGFLSYVLSNQHTDRRMVISGSSCLVCVIWRGNIFVAHIGTSRAVNGRTNDYYNTGEVLPALMTDEHDINSPLIRQEVTNQHQHDPDFVIPCNDGRYRVKGVSEIARSIGDAYLKRVEFKVPRYITDFQLSSPIIEPGLSSEPSIRSRPLAETDRFFIFASHGFWSHMKSHRAVTLVSNHPRKGIAKRLLRAAQREACRKANFSYSDLVGIPKGYRREIHDDMSVIVVFVNHYLVGVKDVLMELKSFKGFTNNEELKPSALIEVDKFMW